ncbi:MAG: NADH-quinone oxidoreductase subunit C [Candidatus Kariarchaeaceae archaeon]|jgi:NADH-quinone oxidoreductase subunit C
MSQIGEKLQAEFGDAIVGVEDRGEARIEIKVTAEKIVEVAEFSKHEMGFTIPNMCTGVDYKDKMDVIWHISTPDSADILVLKVEIDRDECVVDSLTPVWIGMDWHERETYDLLGVNFTNHPDLRRLLMPENWEGHPLREDYVYRKPVYRKPEDFE